MTPSATVTDFLARSRRRVILLGAVTGAGSALVVALIPAILLRAPSRSPLFLLAAGLLAITLGAIAGALVASRREIATEIERRAPDSRNVVLTAAEVLGAPTRQKSYVVELVASQAAAVLDRLTPATLFPAARAVALLAGGIALWVGATAMLPRDAGPNGIVSRTSLIGGDQGFEVLVSPLPYTGRKAERLKDPTRVEAMAGSRIRITTSTDGARVSMVEGELRPVAGQPRVFETVATSDGFIAVQTAAADRRLVGLTITPDQLPRVKINAPGKDLFIADTKRRLPVEMEARDDIGLASLKLRYTKVSGSGERFTFVEGEIPITVQRSSANEWKAKGTLDLGALSLVQGDMVVYRGVATDGRPNAPVSESDAFIVEITSPLMTAAEGFSQDDQMDKYALSQQMIILKTERLLARASTMSPESLTYNSQMIAAEQRSVRAEFVFMMGGEVAEEVIAAASMTDLNEVAEAEHESELAAGRMVNRGRVALVDAIRRMSRASTMLNDGSPATALPEEKKALVSLQEAFSRTRYLLRALTQRERLDLSRRLTGVLSLAARDTRPAPLAVEDPAVVSLRRALAGIAALAGRSGDQPIGRSDISPGGERRIAGSPQRPNAGSPDSLIAANIAQAIIQVDPSDTTLQRVAAKVQDAGKSLRASSIGDAQRSLDEAATLLTSVLRARLPREAIATESPELRKLRGTLSEARRSGVKR